MNPLQVYVPRLDGPRSGTFERCSTDTFEIYGPCTYQTCYLYLYRTGYDGWMPEKVTVYSYYYQPVTFYYNTYIPNDIWYGFDYCRGYLPSGTAAQQRLEQCVPFSVLITNYYNKTSTSPNMNPAIYCSGPSLMYQVTM